ncbi:hypothetical protein PLESTF_000734200 [Pleodorina starrii]|nr:hypothetical protein PLESTF_000734200 [Pleodorina starrii]
MNLAIIVAIVTVVATLFVTCLYSLAERHRHKKPDSFIPIDMVTAPAELPPAALELKDKGNKAFGEKDYAAARTHYTSALDIAPGNAVLLSNLAATHLALRQWTSALARAEECLAADPGFLKAYGRKAAAQMGLIRPGDAEKTLLAGLSRDPKNQFLKDELDKLRLEEDGDQSPRCARNGSDRPIRDMQARVGLQLNPFAHWPSEAFQAAFLGDEKVFARVFRPEDLKLRAMEARLPLPIVVVAGAQRIRAMSVDPRATSERSSSDSERGSKHGRVLRRLIEAGARVDARDAAGWTALAHATAHHPTLDLAEILLEAGADVNAQDRFGTYPLVNAVMTGEVPSVRLLLRHGAKPDLKDNDGCDALGVSRLNPEIQSMLYKAHTGNKRPGDERVCASCGKAGAKKACAGCGGGAYYCSRDCQAAHWPTHKADCRKPASAPSAAAAAAAAGGGGGGGRSAGSSAAAAAASLPPEFRVGVEVETRELLNLQANLGSRMERFAGGTGKPKTKRAAQAAAHGVLQERDPGSAAAALARVADMATQQSPIKVKIQVPAPPTELERQMMLLAGESPDLMLCYNQDRSLVCRIDGFSGPGRQLADLIRREGILGMKGYFGAFFDERCRRQGGVPCEMVVISSMLAAQPF